MFTGIIREIGEVHKVAQSGGVLNISVSSPAVSKTLAIDDSVSVDGVCQTVVRVTGDEFHVQAVAETLSKTAMGDLRRGSRVNVEPALKIGDALGGHFVQGHVDCTGLIERIDANPGEWLMRVRIPDMHRRHIIPVGSIALHGVSLTVARLEDSLVTVALIPHTLQRTTLGEKRAGERLNIEFDILGKYVERLLESAPGGLTLDKLEQWGYGRKS